MDELIVIKKSTLKEMLKDLKNEIVDSLKVKEKEELTKKEAMEILGCSLSTIDRLIKDKNLPSHKIGNKGKSVRVFRSDVKNLLIHVNPK